ncbi:MmcQ/YjbR family DNA-binding protein [Actinomyces sp. ZJ308]|uniref:MmcQ/YjbR family DNA-binding protein n=1 Tax=Actinomyces sp. ZJ308 TaxID=2708342 RepID=UPI001420D2BC|nr:MmcQ/YjbR family DNA-binding protein [Actinomyces sp. ZJ308]
MIEPLPHPGGTRPARVDDDAVATRRDDLLAHAAGLPGAWAGDKPEWDIPVASVGTRLFLLLIPHTDGRLLANVKLDPEDVVAVRSTYSWVEPGFHQSKRHWASIDLTSPDYRPDTAADMVEDSYRLVLSLLTRRVREAVLLADAAGAPARPTWQW